MVRVKTFAVGPLGTNCYLVYSDRTREGYLIDPGFYDGKIAGFIEKNGIHVKNIINTHGHADHISANGKFGYPVLVHGKDGEFLTNPSKNLSFLAGLIVHKTEPAGFLKDGDVIGDGEIKFEVIHTPGHTPGGISLKMGKTLFTGDTLFCEGVGRTDFPYGDESALMDSVKRLMAFEDDTAVLPGHGPASTIGHERRNNPFLSG